MKRRGAVGLRRVQVDALLQERRRSPARSWCFTASISREIGVGGRGGEQAGTDGDDDVRLHDSCVVTCHPPDDAIREPVPR